MHHPYHSFDSSILHFLQCAAVDPQVLAIKLTIYRTSSESPIIQALMTAARQGKQVAVLVEITARFDEAPNIAWGRQLEQVGAHVAYGVERLKTHVKLALVVREEKNGIRRYVHVGTGNYHEGTARIYEDMGIMSCDRELGANVATVFNELTGATPAQSYGKLLVAPHNLREHFTELIRREARHSQAGRPCWHSGQNESASGHAHHSRTLPRQPGGCAHQPECPRFVLSARGDPRIVRYHSGFQYTRPLFRTFTHLSFRKRG